MKVNLKEFMNTWGERHAFIIGLGDGISFTQTDSETLVDEDTMLYEEEHYHKLGMAIGRIIIFWIIVAGVCAIIRSVA